MRFQCVVIYVVAKSLWAGHFGIKNIVSTARRVGILSDIRKRPAEHSLPKFRKRAAFYPRIPEKGSA